MSVSDKHIVLVVPFFSLGGAETQAFYITKGFIDKGFKVTVLAFSEKSGLLREKLCSVGANCDLIPFDLNWIHMGGVKKFIALFKLIFFFRRLKPDYFFPFTYYPNIVCGSVWRFTQAKKCFWNQRGIEMNEFNFIEKIAKFMKPRYLSNSYVCSDYISQRHGLNENPMVINNGVIANPVKNNALVWNQRIGKKPNEIVFSMIANFYPEKNHEYLISNWSKFCQRNEAESYKLVLAGYSPQAKLLWFIKSLVYDAKLNNVVFLDSTNDVSGLLAVTDYAILTSKSEGCSNFVLESMLNKVPIIVSNIPANREIFDETYPYIFSIEKGFELADQMEAILVDVKKEELAENNLNLIKSKYSISVLQKNYFNIIVNA